MKRADTISGLKNPMNIKILEIMWNNSDFNINDITHIHSVMKAWESTESSREANNKK